jgi:hypothetical protein
MGFRFYRRVRICPGISVNLSRSGPSLCLGVRGAHVTFGRRGVTKTVGLPGTGIYYTSRKGYHTGYHSAASDRHLTAEEQMTATRRVERVLFSLLTIPVLVLLAAWLVGS